jgi:hypothetical protein
MIASKTRLLNAMGSTECGIMGVQVEADNSDWRYHHFSPKHKGLEFHKYHGMYEAVLVRSLHDKYNAIWGSFPDQKEYHTKDLFSKHPTKANHWSYEGRVDDLIVFKNAAKYNPLAFEEQIRSCPLVVAALLIGTGRHQAAALIELREHVHDPEPDYERIKAELWPTIEAASTIAPKHAIVKRTHILFSNPSKPFMRAGKGTVQRSATLRLYEEEIDELYRKFGDELHNTCVTVTG